MAPGSNNLHFNTGELKHTSLEEKVERGIKTDGKAKKNELDAIKYNRDMERYVEQVTRVENSGLSDSDKKELLLELRAEGAKLEHYFDEEVVKVAEEIQEEQQELINQGESMIGAFADIQESINATNFETDKISLSNAEREAIRKKEQAENYKQERIEEQKRHRAVIDQQIRDMRVKRLRANRSGER